MTTMTPIMAIERCMRIKSNTIKTHIMTTAAHANAAAVVLLNFATFLFFLPSLFQLCCWNTYKHQWLKKTFIVCSGKCRFGIQSSRLWDDNCPLHPTWHQPAKRQEIRHRCAHIDTLSVPIYRDVSPPQHHGSSGCVTAGRGELDSVFTLLMHNARAQSKWMDTWSNFLCEAADHFIIFVLLLPYIHLDANFITTT